MARFPRPPEGTWTGHYPRTLPGLRTSVIVTRDREGEVRAFHNVLEPLP